MRRGSFGWWVASAFCLASGALFAVGTPEDSGEAVYVTGEGIAAGGVDVVAYFSLTPDAGSVRGSEHYAYRWKSATWLFSSAENRDRFADNPERYAPAYGGYCAWAMARNALAPIDPDLWAIVDETLYLNYNSRSQRDWTANREKYIRKADANWAKHAAKLTVSE